MCEREGEREIVYIQLTAVPPRLAAVNSATGALWARFPSAEATATEASIAQLEVLLQSIGLYKNKAKNLLGMSQLIVSKHAGEVPAGAAVLVACVCCMLRALPAQARYLRLQ